MCFCGIAQTELTVLVSADVSTLKGGNGDSLPLAISTNGQYVLFESSANNLVEGDTNGAADVLYETSRWVRRWW
jgi:hypothetical protein